MGVLLPTVRDWLSHRADASPDRLAVVDAVSGCSITYAALDERVEQLAGRLGAVGVGVGDRVGLRMGARPAAVALTHAAMRTGAVLVGLSSELTRAELAPRIERADLDLLVTAPDDPWVDADAAGETGPVPVRTLRDERGPPSAGVESTPGDVGGPLAAVDPKPFALPDWELNEPAAMLYTSGTTGRPKLVPLTICNLLASAAASAFRLGVLPDDRWASPLAPSSMGGLGPYYRAALYGTGVVLAPTGPERLRAALTDHAATGVSLVPALLRRLLETGDAGPLSELRAVLVGGASTPRDLVERCLDRDVPVCPTYGMTETTSQVATAAPGAVGTAPESVGRPLLFSDVTVVDDGRRCAAGEPGEIVVSGPTVTPGYHDDETPVGPYGFHTGDRGYRDEDGRLYVLGRLDERIVTGGYTVDPEEVAVALRAHPAAADAAVVGLDDPEWGERVGALVEPADGCEPPTGEALRRHCRDRLAAHKLPRTVLVDSIPRTASGTADREAVRRRLEDARSAGSGAGSEADG